jgi:hypothetical protein
VVVDAVLEELVAEQRLGLVDRGLDGGDGLAGALHGGDRAGQAGLGPVVNHPLMRQMPPARLSSSLKSVCHTLLRRVGGSRNTARLAWASWRRSTW